MLQQLTASSLINFYTRAILNLCMPYAARNEMATAIDLAIDGALSKAAADGTHPYVPSPTRSPPRALTYVSSPGHFAPLGRSQKTTSPRS